MIIALDYDGTYTNDPEAWIKFIELFLTAGHEVICVTMRTPDEVTDMCSILKDIIPIIPTSRASKEKFLLKFNIKPDVWIDDNPFWIYEDSL